MQAEFGSSLKLARKLQAETKILMQLFVSERLAWRQAAVPRPVEVGAPAPMSLRAQRWLALPALQRLREMRRALVMFRGYMEILGRREQERGRQPGSGAGGNQPGSAGLDAPRRLPGVGLWTARPAAPHAPPHPAAPQRMEQPAGVVPGPACHGDLPGPRCPGFHPAAHGGGVGPSLSPPPPYPAPYNTNPLGSRCCSQSQGENPGVRAPSPRCSNPPDPHSRQTQGENPGVRVPSSPCVNLYEWIFMYYLFFCYLLPRNVICIYFL
ncbi:unnamed protein product [Natator depressus]